MATKRCFDCGRVRTDKGYGVLCPDCLSDDDERQELLRKHSSRKTKKLVRTTSGKTEKV